MKSENKSFISQYYKSFAKPPDIPKISNNTNSSLTTP